MNEQEKHLAHIARALTFICIFAGFGLMTMVAAFTKALVVAEKAILLLGGKP